MCRVTPPLACVPVCWMFTALVIVGVIMYLIGAGREGLPETEPAAPADPALAGRTGPPPWWAAALIVGVILIAFALLAWSTWDY